MTTILSAEEKNLMEELLETIEVTQDKTTAKELKRALQEVEDGKARPLEELIRELDREKEIPT
jgi:predicted transcriptional regulator